ncbi:serine acetyltransferase [candidate division KSB1 bacterium]|nr:serine acetyltransferase [candidate division KSB1 bacterium]
MNDFTKRLSQTADKIVRTYDQFGVNRIEEKNLPTFKNTIELLDDLMHIIFPGYFETRFPMKTNLIFHVQSNIDSVYIKCCDLFMRALQAHCRNEDCPKKYCRETASDCALTFIEHIPEIRGALKTDIQAGYEGDPAATGIEEVILCYPFVYAITTHRIAHELYLMEIPLIPRMMSEWAHRRTGIDIHPGAKIGQSFFVDHGTGVVIGETAVIGNRVKIYQGVTLGALSFPRKSDGTLVKGGKRHPTISDDVTIYSGATILGGETVIGVKTVIGANTWITQSVPSNTLVTFQEKQVFRSRKQTAPKNGAGDSIDFEI